MDKKQQSFWITNISKRHVGLADLNVFIAPFTSINLLDSKHYHLTPEQLIKSKTSGSLHAKRRMVVVRDLPPIVESGRPLPLQENAIVPDRKRSILEIEQTKYEELEVSDDDFAKENADTAQTDHLGKWGQK